MKDSEFLQYLEDEQSSCRENARKHGRRSKIWRYIGGVSSLSIASFVTVGEIISDGNDPISFVLVGLAFVSGLASFVASDSKAQELYLRYTRASNAFKELILECRFEGLHQSDPAEARRRAQVVFDALNTGWADVIRSGEESSETKSAE